MEQGGAWGFGSGLLHRSCSQRRQVGNSQREALRGAALTTRRGMNRMERCSGCWCHVTKRLHFSECPLEFGNSMGINSTTVPLFRIWSWNPDRRAARLLEDVCALPELIRQQNCLKTITQTIRFQAHRQCVLIVCSAPTLTLCSHLEATLLVDIPSAERCLETFQCRSLRAQ